MAHFIEHADREFLLYPHPQDVVDAVYKMCALFSDEAFSGSSAVEAVDLIVSGRELDVVEQDFVDRFVVLKRRMNLLTRVIQDISKRFPCDDAEFTRSRVLGIFRTLVLRKPLGPLTGRDEEWSHDKEAGIAVNVRCSRVIKKGDVCYDMNAVFFEDVDGIQFTSSLIRDPISFPYEPTSIVVKLDANENAVDPALQSYADRLRIAVEC